MESGVENVGFPQLAEHSFSMLQLFVSTASLFIKLELLKTKISIFLKMSDDIYFLLRGFLIITCDTQQPSI